MRNKETNSNPTTVTMGRSSRKEKALPTFENHRDVFMANLLELEMSTEKLEETYRKVTEYVSKGREGLKSRFYEGKLAGGDLTNALKSETLKNSVLEEEKY